MGQVLHDSATTTHAARHNGLDAGSGEQRIGKERGDNTRPTAAIASCKMALAVLTRETVPLDRATTQNSLGTALKSLGERQTEGNKAKGCAMLESALGHFAAALEEFEKAGASYYAEGARTNMAALDSVIARLRG